jgi:hypothetical protein
MDSRTEHDEATVAFSNIAKAPKNRKAQIQCAPKTGIQPNFKKLNKTDNIKAYGYVRTYVCMYVCYVCMYASRTHRGFTGTYFTNPLHELHSILCK